MNKHTDWINAVTSLQQQAQSYVLVTLLGTRGSSPRDSGSKMVVSAGQSYASIGGGHLEYRAIEKARKLLSQPLAGNRQKIERFKLGPAVGQCCGGSTSVLFETFIEKRAQIMLFGGGHVGQALIKILADLPVHIRWVDNRESILSKMHNRNNIVCISSENPAAEIQVMPPGSYYLVMTHHHPLDFEIVKTLLQKNDFAYLGLIGSSTKWRRFQHHLKQLNFTPETIEQISCPIGSSRVPGKRPMEIAVSIAAELIAHYQAGASRATKPTGLNWKDIKDLLETTTDDD